MDVTIIELNSYFLYRSIVPYQARLFHLNTEIESMEDFIKLLSSLNSSSDIVFVNGFQSVYYNLIKIVSKQRGQVNVELINLSNLLESFKGLLICINVAKKVKKYHIEQFDQELILPNRLSVPVQHCSYFDKFLVSQNNKIYKELLFQDCSIIHEISLERVFNPI